MANEPICVYVAREIEDKLEPELIPQTIYQKIGITIDPEYLRPRALSQGNPRLLEFTFWITDEAQEIEKDIKKILQRKGYRSRHEISKQTGHGEWYKIQYEEITRIISEHLTNKQIAHSYKKEILKEYFTWE